MTTITVTTEVTTTLAEVRAYPDEVTLEVNLKDDRALTPDQALELAAALVTAANEAKTLVWAVSEEDGYKVFPRDAVPEGWTVDADEVAA